MLVLDLDIERLPPRLIGLERYDAALVLVRIAGQPAGQAVIPLGAPVLERDEVRELLVDFADSAFWEAAARRWLDVWTPPAPAAAVPATIAVCTRERPADLRRCLAAIAMLPDDGQDVLVVDNRPVTDATRRVVEEWPRVRYTREDRPGLDAARNRALREAKGAVVVFTDDDAAPDPGWLRALLRNFEDPLVMAATGLTIPFELETAAQQWYQRLGGFSRGLRRRVLESPRDDPFDAWEAGAGVNMALRRELVDLIGGFDEALDVGTPTAGGGDSDMFRRILNGGFRIVYDPTALCWHLHRREWKALRKQLYGYESAAMAIHTRALLWEGDLSVPWRVLRWALREARYSVGSVVGRTGSPPLDLVGARLLGTITGPWSYLVSRRRARAAARTDGTPPGAPERLVAGRTEGERPSAPPSQRIGTLRLSVIIPTHQRLATVSRTLSALARCAGAAEGVEVIVVADGCTDGTAERLRERRDPFRLRVLERPRSGPGPSRYAGAALAGASLLLFLDDDVEPDPSLLDAHLRAHAAGIADVLLGPYPPGPSCPGRWLDASLRGWWNEHFDRVAGPGHRWSFRDVVTGNLSISRGLFDRVGGFAPELAGYGGEDWELGYRLIRAGASLRYLPEARAVHRLEPLTARRLIDRARQEGRACQVIAALHPELTGVLKPVALAGTDRRSRWARRLAYRAPGVSGLVLAALAIGLRVTERVGARGTWDRLNRMAYTLAFARGMASHPAPRVMDEPVPAPPALPQPRPELPPAELGLHDARLARERPELARALPLAQFEHRFGVRGRVFYTLVFRWPGLGAALVKRLEGRRIPGLPVARWAWKLRYFQGVAHEIRSPRDLAALVWSAAQAPDETAPAFDLADGFAAVEDRLDALRPMAARILLSGRSVASIPAVAGTEPLRGEHLRPFLSREARPALLRAWIEAGRVPELTGRAARLACEALERHALWWRRTKNQQIWWEQYQQWNRVEELRREAHRSLAMDRTEAGAASGGPVPG